MFLLYWSMVMRRVICLDCVRPHERAVAATHFDATTLCWRCGEPPIGGIHLYEHPKRLHSVEELVVASEVLRKGRLRHPLPSPSPTSLPAGDAGGVGAA
jgi:hypothetical protein